MDPYFKAHESHARDRCSPKVGSDVISGVGSVLFLISLTLMIVGAVFTGVAFSTPETTKSAYFHVMGPLLMGCSGVLALAGYSMCHSSDVKVIWLHCRQRKQMAYVRNDDDVTEDYKRMRGAWCALILFCMSTCCLRHHNNVGAGVGSVDDVELGGSLSSVEARGEGHNKRFSSFSSFKQTRVHPETLSQTSVC